MYFTRDSRGTPEAWVESMVHCLATVPPQFNTDRMVQEYADRAYKHLAGNYFAQQNAKKAPARDVGKEVVRIRNAFPQVKIVAANTVELQDFKVGQHLDVTLDVDVGSLSTNDIVVELVLQQLDSPTTAPLVVPMKPSGEVRGAIHAYVGTHSVEKTGRYAHGMRVRARAPGLDVAMRGLVIWA
jgi:starch phosphorylase